MILSSELLKMFSNDFLQYIIPYTKCNKLYTIIHITVTSGLQKEKQTDTLPGAYCMHADCFEEYLIFMAIVLLFVNSHSCLNQFIYPVQMNNLLLKLSYPA